MNGNQLVIDNLNKQLTLELTSMDQYLAHAKMYEDWGIMKLHERIALEFEDEKGHAQALIERILFLEGKPDVSKREGLAIGSDVKSMLMPLLEDTEEDHVYWLEQQLGLIGRIGSENYIQSMM